jgi:hypothetical protein
MSKIKTFFPVIIAFLMTVTVVNCKDKTAAKPAAHGTITFLRGTVEVNGVKTALGTLVNAKDKIEVKEKSTAVIQFENNAMITVEANTKLSVDTLLMGENGQPKIAITQQSGSTFNKIMPGKADYNIRTPTITAGVRGTAFSLDMKDEKTAEIKLFRGKVALTQDAAGAVEGAKSEEVILEAGNKLEITEGQKLAEVTQVALAKEEVESLSKLNEIAFVAEESLTKMEDATIKGEDVSKVMEDIPAIVPESIEQVIIQVEIKKEERAQAQSMTLAELAAKYGKLSKVITKDKKEYIGSFRQVGGNIEVITVDGKKILDVKQIAKVSPYK